ncbi:MAG: hypothetical protein HRU15_20615, partial [Planctomycetes bacterium]|nr:hypothetical protein [Planctomycetota bacterium]
MRTQNNTKACNHTTLSRSDILASLNSVAAEVHVPELGGSVGIRRLSFAQTLILTQQHTEDDQSSEGQQNFLIRLLIACVCDQQGTPIFKEKD